MLNVTIVQTWVSLSTPSAINFEQCPESDQSTSINFKHCWKPYGLQIDSPLIGPKASLQYCTRYMYIPSTLDSPASTTRQTTARRHVLCIRHRTRQDGGCAVYKYEVLMPCIECDTLVETIGSVRRCSMGKVRESSDPARQASLSSLKGHLFVLREHPPDKRNRHLRRCTVCSLEGACAELLVRESLIRQIRSGTDRIRSPPRTDLSPIPPSSTLIRPAGAVICPITF